MCFFGPSNERIMRNANWLAGCYALGGQDRVYFELGRSSLSSSKVRREYLQPLENNVTQSGTFHGYASSPTYRLVTCDYEFIEDVLREYCEDHDNCKGDHSERYSEICRVHGTLSGIKGSSWTPPFRLEDRIIGNTCNMF